MKIAFDPVKDAANRAKHGLSLAFGARLFDDADHLVFDASHPRDGEMRFKIVAEVGDRLYTAVFVWRGRTRRFISVRRSNDAEERRYRDPG